MKTSWVAGWRTSLQVGEKKSTWIQEVYRVLCPGGIYAMVTPKQRPQYLHVVDWHSVTRGNAPFGNWITAVSVFVEPKWWHFLGITTKHQAFHKIHQNPKVNTTLLPQPAGILYPGGRFEHLGHPVEPLKCWSYGCWSYPVSFVQIRYWLQH